MNYRLVFGQVVGTSLLCFEVSSQKLDNFHGLAQNLRAKENWCLFISVHVIDSHADSKNNSSSS